MYIVLLLLFDLFYINATVCINMIITFMEHLSIHFLNLQMLYIYYHEYMAVSIETWHIRLDKTTTDEIQCVMPSREASFSSCRTRQQLLRPSGSRRIYIAVSLTVFFLSLNLVQNAGVHFQLFVNGSFPGKAMRFRFTIFFFPSKPFPVFTGILMIRATCVSFGQKKEGSTVGTVLFLWF